MLSTPTTLALTLCALFACNGLAQQASPRKPETTRPVLVNFADEPLRIAAIGLTMQLPVGCRADATTGGTAASVQITPQDGSWLLNIQTSRTVNPDTKAEEVLRAIMIGVLRATGEVYEQGRAAPPEVGDADRIIGVLGAQIGDRQVFELSKLPAARGYVSIKSDAGDSKYVRGYTVIKNSPTQVVVMELVCPESAFGTARQVYETVVGTSFFEDPARVNADREAVIRAGLKIFEGVNADVLKEIIAPRGERWLRRYRPSPDGSRQNDVELGYSRIRAKTGMRGDVTRQNNDVADRQQGLVLQLDFRILDGKQMYDSRGAFFMTPDRTEEIWLVENALRDGTQTIVAVERGARSGDTMIVQTEQQGLKGDTIKPLFQGDGYITRVEDFLLPQIIIRSKVPTDLGFYAYRSDAGRIRMRRDTLDRDPARPDVWRLRSRLAEDKPEQVAFYNEAGDLIRLEMPDGTVWEPTTLDALAKLWRSKGLPLN